MQEYLGKRVLVKIDNVTAKNDSFRSDIFSSIVKELSDKGYVLLRSYLALDDSGVGWFKCEDVKVLDELPIHEKINIF